MIAFIIVYFIIGILICVFTDTRKFAGKVERMFAFFTYSDMRLCERPLNSAKRLGSGHVAGRRPLAAIRIAFERIKERPGLRPPGPNNQC